MRVVEVVWYCTRVYMAPQRRGAVLQCFPSHHGRRLVPRKLHPPTLLPHPCHELVSHLDLAR